MIWFIGGLFVFFMLVLLVLTKILGASERAQQTKKIGNDQLLQQHLLERYVVTLLSGESFSGLLAAVDDRTLVLRDVEVLSANAAKADGDVVLRREAIAYMQRPTA